MKKLNRKGILVLIILLAVGFAAVSTSLIINGTSLFGVNESDFDVYFSYAEIDGEDKSAEIISPNGKSITFATKNMSFLNEKTMLDFIVTNNSSQYDAKVSVNCIDIESKKVDITYSMVDEIIKAKENKTGNITIELISNTLEEDEIEFTCTIEATAQEKEEAGVPSAPENPEAASTYSIYGYLEDEEGNVLPNANLVVYSNTPHYVTTDSRGYFYVEELEAGSHEIYYMGSIETANLTKEEVKEQAIDEVNITTSTKNITFNKGHKITSSKIENTLNKDVEIKFDAGDGSVAVEDITGTHNKEYGTLPEPKKEGYTFEKLVYEDGTEVTKDTIIPTGSNHTLKAVYQENEYTINFNSNNGTGSMESMTQKYTKEVTLTKNTFTRTGYTFAGWNTKADGTGESYSDEANISKLVGSGNITLYAKWTAHTYTVKYNGNGATGGSTASSTHTYDVSQNLTANGFTKAYTVTYNANGGSVSTSSANATYTFSGWATSSDGSVVHTDKKSVTNLSSTDGSTVNLYAIWSGGKLSSLPTPTRTGYKFKGWYTAASGGTQITTSTVFTKAQTIYAQWTVNKYTITLSGSKVSFKNASGTAISSTTVNYGNTAQVTITPTTNYYISGVSCTNGYTATTTTGESATSSATLTIKNNSKAANTTCTVTTKLLSACQTAINGYTYSYTGGIQTFTAPCTGKYQLSLVGGSGGASYSNQTPGTQNGSRGNEISGVITLNAKGVLKIAVGGAGENGYYRSLSADVVGNSAYGGGGGAYFQGVASSYNNWIASAGGGGGATTVYMTSESASNRILVAGGGGGASTWSQWYMNEHGNDPLMTWSERAGFGGSSSSTGNNGGGEKYSGSSNDRRVLAGGGGGWTGGSSSHNGTNGYNSSYISSVISSTSYTEGGTNFTVSAFGNNGLQQSANNNGSAIIKLISY